jgi:hypothetical protein
MQNKSSAWAWSATLAGLFVAVQVQASLTGGSLSLPPTYDDLAYITDAANRLETFYADGVPALLAQYAASPPHSPLHSLIAFSGFSIFGVHHWAAIAMNAVPLALLIRLFFRLADGVPARLVTSFVVVLLLIPFAGLLVIDFRPDMLCAILTAAGCLVIVLRPWALDRREAATAGCLFGLALLSKPPIFMLTMASFGLAMMLATLPHLRTRAFWPELARSWALTWGIAAVFALPHFIFAAPAIIGYIITTMFSEQAKVWVPQMALRDTLLFYLTGPGSISLGPWKAVVLAVWILFALALLKIRSGRYRAACVVVLAVFTYAVITATGNKSAFLGIAFPAFLIASMAAVWLFLAHRVPLPLTTAATTILLCVGLGLFKFPAQVLWGGPLSPTHVENRNRNAAFVTDILAADPAIAQKTVYQPVISQYMTADMIGFLLAEKHKPRPTWAAPYLSTKTDDHHAALSRSHYAIVFTADSTEPLSWVPSAAIRQEALDLVRNGGFQEIARTPDESGRGAIVIYRRL